MPEYLSPGVYIEEIRTGPVPIEGVGTSTSGFVGQTERGPLEPRLVTSWLEYQRWYGGHINPAVSYLPYAVQGFFDNGGQRLFVARVTSSDAIPATIQLATDGEPLVLRAIGPGEWGTRVRVRVSAGSTGGFRLTFLYYSPGRLPEGDFVDPFDIDEFGNPNRRDPDVVEDYDNLTGNPLDPAYVVATLQAGSQLVEVLLGDNPPGTPQNADWAPLTGGGDGGPADYDTDYIGDTNAPPDDRTGLAAFALIDEIALLCVPDEVFSEEGQITEQLLLQCEQLKDRFAILQYRNNVTTFDELRNRRPRPSLYGAVYFPWIRVFDPIKRDTVLVPPGGHVTGIFARTDNERGVHKAPANADVRGIITQDLSGNRRPVALTVTKGFQDLLNPRGINVIRDFRADGRGIRIWGARTLAADADWKYVNVRRLFIFVEESIDQGTQWVVFEPNYEPTWAAVTRSISNFLTRVWRDGALAGITADEAFFVKCDRTTMTPDDIDNGKLICYIGIAPVKPAEFVIFRISQKTIEFAS